MHFLKINSIRSMFGNSVRTNVALNRPNLQIIDTNNIFWNILHNLWRNSWKKNLNNFYSNKIFGKYDLIHELWFNLSKILVE